MLATVCKMRNTDERVDVSMQVGFIYSMVLIIGTNRDFLLLHNLIDCVKALSFTFIGSVLMIM